MSQKLVVASVPISITVFSLGFITIRKTGLRIVCRVIHIIFLSHLFLLFSCLTMQPKRFLFSQTQSGIVLMKYDDIVVNVLPAPFPGFFEVRVFVQMAYLNAFLSYKFNMPKKNKSVTFLQFFFNHFSAASRSCFRGFFLTDLICRKKIKKRNFFCKSFLVFLLAIFFPFFFRLFSQQKSRILFRFCCTKNFFFFNKVIKPIFGKQILNCFYEIFFWHPIDIKAKIRKNTSIVIWPIFPSTFC